MDKENKAMKWAKEQFRKLETFDFVEDTIEDENTPYSKEKDIYEKWMLYKASVPTC